MHLARAIWSISSPPTSSRLLRAVHAADGRPIRCYETNVELDLSARSGSRLSTLQRWENNTSLVTSAFQFWPTSREAKASTLLRTPDARIRASWPKDGTTTFVLGPSTDRVPRFFAQRRSWIQQSPRNNTTYRHYLRL